MKGSLQYAQTAVPRHGHAPLRLNDGSARPVTAPAPFPPAPNLRSHQSPSGNPTSLAVTCLLLTPFREREPDQPD
jgi:hypothetical protein